MSNESNQFIKEMGYTPKVDFTDRQVHLIEFGEGKIDTVDFGQGKGEERVMTYLVKENGEDRKITTTSVGLVGDLAQAKAGDVFEIQMITKSVNGKPKAGYVVKQVGNNPVADVEPLPENFGDDIEIDNPIVQ